MVKLPTTLQSGVDPSSKPPRLMVHLRCHGTILLCLIDTGAEINLMRQKTAEDIILPLQDLPRPTFVNLAMDNGSTAPIVLRHFVATTMTDPTTSHSFTNIVLKLGPMKGPYDPVLELRATGLKILDHRLLGSKPTWVAAINDTPSLDYPCSSSETKIFAEFNDLFPVDIPAVSDEAEEAGLFVTPLSLKKCNWKTRGSATELS
ncbi:hypothetical protein Pst134EA_001191 [Puccinia striiformis f. sp. tritici]|uniref:hypothetical protein n=1 Tax=Puccinia striiformis f. sp. tritici TaxID=168172 RepID=UPI002008A60D|nr:hypothetical protein Pst134EA_001191 [Puccinia striiformis f. sp. tritici]KAH9474150.1 hypothetical protein Pst134EA_001191 [Puccinia striiformis f. sp. tritici]